MSWNRYEFIKDLVNDIDDYIDNYLQENWASMAFQRTTETDDLADELQELVFQRIDNENIYYGTSWEIIGELGYWNFQEPHENITQAGYFALQELVDEEIDVYSQIADKIEEFEENRGI